jgi:hypothetical protein
MRSTLLSGSSSDKFGHFGEYFLIPSGLFVNKNILINFHKSYKFGLLLNGPKTMIFLFIYSLFL